MNCLCYYSIHGWSYELSVFLQYTGGGDMNCLCSYSIQGWRYELSVFLQYTGVEI